IWEPMDAETSSKTKYAKYHALRIAKAIKAGEDPNSSNPRPEPIPSPEPTLDPSDPDVQMLDESPRPPAAYQPTVEEVPDEHDRLERHLAQRSSVDQSLHPSRAPSVPRPPESLPQESIPTNQPVENYYQDSSVPDVSPLQSSDRGRNGSIGGGYFPRPPEAGDESAPSPDTNDQVDGLNYPSAPQLPDTSSLPLPAPYATSAPPFSPPEESAPSLPPSSLDYGDMSTASAPVAPSGPHPPGVAPFQAPRYPQPSAPSIMPHPTPPPFRQRAPPPPPSFSQQTASAPPTVVDEEAISKAQKHARWAISALNFEDVTTAVKELRGALESLGAR
ncbi:MAG: hypothetical protein Q9224_006354, partial [Gallowayella concinna]